MIIYGLVYYNNFFYLDVIYIVICNSILFYDYGNNIEGKNVYMEFFFNDKILCYEECKYVKVCLGYMYEDDL